MEKPVGGMLCALAAMDAPRVGAYNRMMNLGTSLYTLLHGRLVGRDDAGNRFFQERKPKTGQRARRWVLFKGVPEASAIGPGWFGWLHYTVDEPVSLAGRRPWWKPHLPNLTGTSASYRPAGHEYEGGRRRQATGDYEAWSPDQE